MLLAVSNLSSFFVRRMKYFVYSGYLIAPQEDAMQNKRLLLE